MPPNLPSAFPDLHFPPPRLGTLREAPEGWAKYLHERNDHRRFADLLSVDSSDPSTLFQDSTLATPATADGDPVGGWKDHSRWSLHLRQATASKKPILKLNQLNGKPVLRFDGVDDFLATAAQTLASPLTIYAVLRQTTWVNFTFLTDSVSIDEFSLMRYFNAPPNLYLRSTSTIAGDSPLAVGAFGILTMINKASPCTLQVNNDAPQSAGFPGLDLHGFVLGSRGNGAQASAIDVAEILIRPGEESSLAQTARREALSAKWGIAL